MQFTIPSNTYPAGTRSFGPFTINANLSHVAVSFTRENWPDVGPLLDMLVEYSKDNGQTFQVIEDMRGVPGGVVLFKGQPAPTSGVDILIPDVGLAGRQLRATETNSATFTTAVTVNAQ
jgi:hypothetical protein